MYQRDGARQVLVERVNCFGEVSFGAAGEIVLLRVLADEDVQPDLGHQVEQRSVPAVRELSSGRQVTGGALAGVVKIHGKQCEQAWIAELGFGHPEPVEEFDAAGVVPGDAALLGFVAGCLADYSDSRVWPSRVERQVAE